MDKNEEEKKHKINQERNKINQERKKKLSLKGEKERVKRGAN